MRDPNPTQGGERRLTDLERRQQAEIAVGKELTKAFAQGEQAVRYLGGGWRELHTYLPGDERGARMHILEHVDEKGARHAIMTYEARKSWSSRMIYKEIPGFHPQLVAARTDMPANLQAELPSNHYNNQDSQIGFWGEAWQSNLHHGVSYSPG